MIADVNATMSTVSKRVSCVPQLILKKGLQQGTKIPKAGKSGSENAHITRIHTNGRKNDMSCNKHFRDFWFTMHIGWVEGRSGATQDEDTTDAADMLQCTSNCNFWAVSDFRLHTPIAAGTHRRNYKL